MVSTSVKGGIIGGAIAGSVVIVFLVIMSPSLQLDIADTLNISCRDRAFAMFEFSFWSPMMTDFIEKPDITLEEFQKMAQEYEDNCSNFDLPKFQEEYKEHMMQQLQEQYSQQLQEQYSQLLQEQNP